MSVQKLDEGRFASAIQREKDAERELFILADELASAAEPLASRGDGNCGFILDAVKQALVNRGIYRETRFSKSASSKKEIIPQSLRTRVFERDAYRYVHCGAHLDLTVDHIHPESKGGTLDFFNLQTLCRPCNSSKGVS